MKAQTAKQIGIEFGLSDRQVKRWQSAGMPYSKELVEDAEGRARWTCLYNVAEVWDWLTAQGATLQGAVKTCGEQILKCHKQDALPPDARAAWLAGYFHGVSDGAEYLIDDPDNYEAAMRATRPERLRQLERLQAALERCREDTAQ